MLTLTDAARRPDVRAVLLQLNGVDARTALKADLFNQIHALVGPVEHRSFAILDLVMNYYTCDLNRDSRFKRNKAVL